MFLSFLVQSRYLQGRMANPTISPGVYATLLVFFLWLDALHAQGLPAAPSNVSSPPLLPAIVAWLCPDDTTTTENTATTMIDTASIIGPMTNDSSNIFDANALDQRSSLTKICLQVSPVADPTLPESSTTQPDSLIWKIDQVISLTVSWPPAAGEENTTRPSQQQQVVVIQNAMAQDLSTTRWSCPESPLHDGDPCWIQTQLSPSFWADGPAHRGTLQVDGVVRVVARAAHGASSKAVGGGHHRGLPEATTAAEGDQVFATPRIPPPDSAESLERVQDAPRRLRGSLERVKMVDAFPRQMQESMTNGTHLVSFQVLIPLSSDPSKETNAVSSTEPEHIRFSWTGAAVGMLAGLVFVTVFYGSFWCMKRAAVPSRDAALTVKEITIHHKKSSAAETVVLQKDASSLCSTSSVSPIPKQIVIILPLNI